MQIESPPTINVGGLLQYYINSGLPHFGPLVGGAVQLIAGLNAKGIVKLIHIGNHTVYTELAGRVWVGKQLLAQGLWAGMAPPYLCQRQEEALVRRKPVYLILVLVVHPKGFKSNGTAT